MQSALLELYKNAVEYFRKPEPDFSVEKLTEEEVFGKHISRTLARFNPRQRAIAKKKISDVLFEVETGNLGNTQPSIYTEDSCMFPMNSYASSSQRTHFNLQNIVISRTIELYYCSHLSETIVSNVQILLYIL